MLVHPQSARELIALTGIGTPESTNIVNVKVKAVLIRVFWVACIQRLQIVPTRF
jgi:hypothetical protein